MILNDYVMLRGAASLQVLRLQAAAKQAGFSDVVYLDAVSDTYLEEVSSCNIFTVTGKTLRTPGLKVHLGWFLEL